MFKTKSIANVARRWIAPGNVRTGQRGYHSECRTLKNWAALILCVFLCGTALAQPGFRGPVDRGEPSTLDTENGFLFIDGVYISPPYSIDMDGESIVVNGSHYELGYFDLSAFQGFGGRRGPGVGGGARGRGFNRERGPNATRPDATFGWTESDASSADSFHIRRLLHTLQTLDLGAIHVLDKDKSPWELWPNQAGHELLEDLIKNTKDEIGNVTVPESLVGSESEERWETLVTEFDGDEDFLSRAEAIVSEINDSQSRNESSLAANKWAQRLNFPMTVFALVLAVFAVGHLMSEATQAFSETVDEEPTKKSSKAFVRSLLIIGLMSGIDLAWTLLAHQAGSMRELNPLGSRLIDNPINLIAFKIAVTGGAIALLHSLRNLPLARKATWWCCLVLTLVTARWLTFHSMLI